MTTLSLMPMLKTAVQVAHLHKSFERFPAIRDLSLSVQEGEILGLLGPSGCGKTTLLRLIAGLDTPDAGEIRVGDRCVVGANVFIPPEQRSLGMVFQDFALFPHLTVAENIAFGLQQQRLSKPQIQERVAAVLALVHLEGMQKRYPHELSGGQQQRVALARAIAPQPAVILLDEPLSNLDAQVRLQLREELRRILKGTGTTAIFVTHDREEALSLADRLAVMRQGKIEQVGTPEDIYRCPASRFVAGFITQANFLPAYAEGAQVRTDVGTFPLLAALAKGEGEVMIREEDLQLQPDPEASSCFVIRDRQFLGREYRYCIQLPSGQELHARQPLAVDIPIGTAVNVAAEAVRFFPKEN
ncbi:ABC-type FeII uptake system ATPase component FutC [Thermosynechococcus sp. NK55a]|uniref:ABC transporter ATP-binding protein n=1 Tax=Thermosynechococcus sp. NK55a TaxID=1394889 RepID=UPI0003D8A77D|nr:ABC-type FeII uptake system ATPase component FutC [Thermosynechococcus sp. NK55a]